jgi:hypothetical protein
VTDPSSDPGSEPRGPNGPERTLAAGPLFLFGLALTVLGVARRRPILALGGAVAMWVDRESVLGGLRGERP